MSLVGNNLKRIAIYVPGVLALCLSAGWQHANATVFTMTHNGASASVQSANSSGMFDWRVSPGGNQMFQQWFWIRAAADTGAGDQATGAEHSIDAMTFDAGNSGLSNGDRSLKLTYNETLDGTHSFQVVVNYTLTGSPPFNSSLLELVSVKNTGTGNLDLHFFQYSDVDLGQIAGDDTANFISPNAIEQFDSEFPGINFHEASDTPTPNHWEIDTFSNTRTGLNDGAPTTLCDCTSGITGDVTWAFQWDVLSMTPGFDIGITKTKGLQYDSSHQSPEPATLALFGLGLVGASVLRRRMRKTH